VEIDVSFASVLIPGLVALVAAFLGVAPHLGRLRRLERIVAILEKTQDESGRARLLAMRDHIITELETNARGERNRVIVGGAIYIAAYASVLGAFFSITSSNGGEAPAPLWMWAWLLTSSIAVLVGAVLFVSGLRRWRARVRAGRTASESAG
jgi:hypothetical protein